MAKESVDALVEGGKASAAPPLGPALGPLKVNIGQVISEINKKTEAFKGMKVPVKIIVDTETKAFEITVGTPPVSDLIKKEIGIQKGSGIPNKDKVGNIAVEDAIKVAKMKLDALSAKDMKHAVKTVIGSCNAMGVLVEGKTAVEINPEIDGGAYDSLIAAEITDVPKEKRARLAQELDAFRKKFAAELVRIAAEKKAKEEAVAAKKAATDSGAATPATPGAAPAAGAAPTAKAPAGKAPAAKASAKK